MSKKKISINPAFVPAALFVTMAAYYLYQRDLEEENNNFYNHPVNSFNNYFPIMLSSFLATTTSLVAITLSLNPERSNFEESNQIRITEGFTKALPTLVAGVMAVGTKVSSLILGERSEAVNEALVKGTSLFEQVMRVAIISERLHSHHIARGVVDENGIIKLRYIRQMAFEIESMLVGGVEISVAYLWWMANNGLIRALPTVNDKNKLVMLSFFYLMADSVEDLLNHVINTRALALEIWADNLSDILNKLKLAGTKEYKVDEPEIISVIRSNKNELLEEIENGIKIAEEEIEKKINQAADIARKEVAEKYQLIVQSIENLKDGLSLELTQAKDKVTEFIEKNVHLENLNKQLQEKKEEIENNLRDAYQKSEQLAKNIAKEIQEKLSLSAQMEDLEQLNSKLNKEIKLATEYLKTKVADFENDLKFIIPKLGAFEGGLEALNSYTTKVQSYWRRKQAINQLNVLKAEKAKEEELKAQELRQLQEKQQKSSSATKIQSLWRGKQAVNQLEMHKAEKLKQEQIEKARLEQEQIEKARLEQEQIEKARLEQERIENEREIHEKEVKKLHEHNEHEHKVLVKTHSSLLEIFGYHKPHEAEKSNSDSKTPIKGGKNNAAKPKTDKASGDVYEVKLDNASYVKFAAEKIAELFLTLSSSLKALVTPKNEEKDDYQSAITQANKANEYKASVNYEAIMLENFAKSLQSRKIGVEAIDSFMVMENSAMGVIDYNHNLLA
jgi:hypothetical protein